MGLEDFVQKRMYKISFMVFTHWDKKITYIITIILKRSSLLCKMQPVENVKFTWVTCIMFLLDSAGLDTHYRGMRICKYAWSLHMLLEGSQLRIYSWGGGGGGGEEGYGRSFSFLLNPSMLVKLFFFF